MTDGLRNTYRSATGASQDKAQLAELLAALYGSPSALRRDEAGLWILRGSRGYCSTWGDERTCQLIVAPQSEMSSKKAWTWIKKRLAFAELTQDGDEEGCFRLHRLPTTDEAEKIRDIVGIRKRVDWSPEELSRRQEAGRRLLGAGRCP